MTTELSQQVERLAVARELSAQIDDNYRAVFDAWLAEIGAALDQERKKAKAAVAELEAMVREAALKLYEETKEKQPAAGIAIRMKKVINYQANDAFAWALEHKIALIPTSLDTNQYEKLVLAGAAPGEITEVPEATIARDLAAALKGA